MDYLVIGSGEEYAYGSLATTTNCMKGEKRVRLGIKSAFKFCGSVDDNIDIYKLQLDNSFFLRFQ